MLSNGVCLRSIGQTRQNLTPPSKCPGERSDCHRVLVTEGYGQIFSGELEFCNEDSIIIGRNCFYVKNNSSNFSPGFACLLPRFHL